MFIKARASNFACDVAAELIKVDPAIVIFLRDIPFGFGAILITNDRLCIDLWLLRADQ